MKREPWMNTQGGAGDAELHRRYVGPVERWNRSAKHQADVVRAEGLAPSSTLVDLGCGPLCAGSLLIPWLEPGRYVGVEPNVDVVAEAFRRERGLEDLVKARQARVVEGDCLAVPDLVEAGDVPADPDLVLMHSIFSHMRREMLVHSALALHQAFAPGVPVVASFVLARDRRNVNCERKDGPQWEYPGLVRYPRRDLTGILESCGFDVAWRGYREPGKQRWARLVNAA